LYVGATPTADLTHGSAICGWDHGCDLARELLDPDRDSIEPDINAIAAFDQRDLFLGDRMHGSLDALQQAFDGSGNTQFLAEQMTACEKVIADRYPTLGFPAP
jgi:hypothetical protein